MPGRNASAMRKRVFGVVWLVVFVGILIEVPTLGWFMLAAILVGGLAVFVLRWYYKRKPLKVDDPAEHNVLGLQDKRDAHARHE